MERRLNPDDDGNLSFQASERSMRFPVSGHRPLLPLMTLVLASCGDSLFPSVGDPSGIDGIFALVEVNGAPPPATSAVDGGETDFQLLADTLILHDRTWARITWTRRGPLPIDRTGTVRGRSDGFVTREGASCFVLDFTCNDTGSCLPPDRFERRGGSLFIERGFALGFENLRYERATPSGNDGP